VADTDRHDLDMAVSDTVAEARMFRAECSCGWVGKWMTTNACMGRGRRHVAAKRRAAANKKDA